MSRGIPNFKRFASSYRQSRTSNTTPTTSEYRISVSSSMDSETSRSSMMYLIALVIRCSAASVVADIRAN